jgi:hypothetical protein
MTLPTTVRTDASVVTVTATEEGGQFTRTGSLPGMIMIDTDAFVVLA